MVFTDKQIKSAVETFRENEYWREYYDNAPSDDCRKYIAFKFCHSLHVINSGEYGKTEQVENEYKRLEEKLKLNDWRWLYRYSGNNPERIKFKQKIDEMKNM